MTTPITVPDLSERPFSLQVEREMTLTPAALYLAWTRQFDRWFAAPGSVIMQGEVDTAFFFETVYQPDAKSKPMRHPHYGRFLRLEQDRFVELTWVTGTGGTKGTETVVTIEIQEAGDGSRIFLTHAGFPDAESRDQHEYAWPMVLEQLEQKLGKREG
ncbi:SRPBCC family protein [Brevibacillus choshinensis]|uniref:SRPBCC domain-containing protein n=1 Tax=Brevibacillus choshinensis TaxID=54911 RepID=A0ABX7FVH4_BRECH|nr:SRPBCC domain-containing protein [Brevibacillus choshinensis]QRG70202.1 SRPBCC domain-containing protein [Brevibacillus choshinensis]